MRCARRWRIGSFLLPAFVLAHIGCAAGSKVQDGAGGTGGSTSEGSGGAGGALATTGTGNQGTTAAAGTGGSSGDASTSSGAGGAASTSSASASSSSSASTGTGIDPCGGVQCVQPPSSCYASIGTCSNGACSYPYQNGAACDDGDPCTIQDACASGVCKATPVMCNAPPPAICQTPTTARTYLPAGACSLGACGYPFSDTVCAFGCNAGQCNVTPTAVAIAAGGYHTCAVATGGGVTCWGRGSKGQLGNNATSDSHVPVGVTGLQSGVVAVSANSYHTCALTTAGGVVCWGENTWGQLGNGSKTNSLVPVPVTGLSSGVVAISAGDRHTCALTSAGGVKCWGYNANGQLGNNSMIDTTVPLDVSGLISGVIAIVAAGGHSCAVTSAGAVKCWGWNSTGQLGNGSATDSPIPVAVTALPSNVVAITGGYGHTCAMTSGGTVTCWGRNDYGQVSNVGALGGVSFSAVSTTSLHTCGLTAIGGGVCWGYGQSGELGNNAATSSSIPVNVTGLGSGLAAISAGGSHSCAITSSGGIACWGYNIYGQLGNNSIVNSPVPVNTIGF